MPIKWRILSYVRYLFESKFTEMKLSIDKFHKYRKYTGSLAIPENFAVVGSADAA